MAVRSAELTPAWREAKTSPDDQVLAHPRRVLYVVQPCSGSIPFPETAIRAAFPDPGSFRSPETPQQLSPRNRARSHSPNPTRLR